MQTKPKEFWIDGDTLQRFNTCTHIARTNEFVDGVRCYVADEADKERFIWCQWGAAYGFFAALVLIILLKGALYAY
mgnify:CR=1 FL=1